MGRAEGHFPDMPRAFPSLFLTDFQVLAAQGAAKSYVLFVLVLLSCSWCVSQEPGWPVLQG